MRCAGNGPRRSRRRSVRWPSPIRSARAGRARRSSATGRSGSSRQASYDTQELLDGSAKQLGLLQVGEVPALIEHAELGARDRLGNFGGALDRNEIIGPVDHQRRASNIAQSSDQVVVGATPRLLVKP